MAWGCRTGFWKERLASGRRRIRQGTPREACGCRAVWRSMGEAPGSSRGAGLQSEMKEASCAAGTEARHASEGGWAALSAAAVAHVSAM